MRQPTLAEYTQVMTRCADLVAARDRAIAARNEAVEERDLMLSVLEDVGAALCHGLRTTAAGVEVRELYPSHAAALAAAMQVRRLLALMSPAAGEG